MKTFILFGLLLTSAFAMADVIATGEEARIDYEAMTGPDVGPYCTGLCIPGRPCDPTCTTTRNAATYYCSKVSFSSGRVEYTCYSKESNG